MQYIAPTVNYNINQIGHFKQLIAGAGANIFKANDFGVFAGAGKYSSAPFRLGYNGNIYTTGTIRGGSASGLEVEVDGVNGKINFYYNSSRVGYLVGINTGDMALDADKDLYFSANKTQSLMIVGATAGSATSGDIWLRAGGSKIMWSSGRYLKDGGSQITCDGKFVATTSGGDADIQSQRDIIGGRDVKCDSTGNFYKGTSQGYEGDLKDSTDTKIATVKGGIITGVEF